MGNTLQPDRDRLSNLPDDILLHILRSLNDTKSAVRTSVLSTRWRHLWTYLQDLNFDINSFPPGGDRSSSFNFVRALLGRQRRGNCDISRIGAFTRDIPSFLNFMRAVLAHQRPGNCRVDRLRFSADVSIGDMPIFTELINYGLSHGVRDLVIVPASPHTGPPSWLLPDLSLASPTLETLNLRKFIIRPSSFGHPMLALTSLNLQNVAYDGGGCFDICNMIPNLTNLCLVQIWAMNKILKITGHKLVRLRLVDVTISGALEISLPNLEVLEYGCYRVNDFSVINLPSLRHAELEVGNAEYYRQRLLKLLNGISNVESLVLNSLLLQALNDSGLLENLASPFPNLKSLKFHSP
ncbi:hypothetical protein Tsubulata_039353 [Turnera subulata]|uniref:F-box domain-containing protein n=1 Tax=Turnera subulata TaxID=218843 RepID=A0A9Q0JHJ7_9ROSI|nr:hypothetical protein Tsubulata_039353 [Turnera subulata]